MRRNFLILEDHQAQLDMLADLVARMDPDIHVYAVTTCEKAYQIAVENTIDCFLIDIIIDTDRPGDTSGAKFVSRIREINRYYTTPVFFITSLEDPVNYAYKSLHCLDYIEKPFDPERIKENIRRVLCSPSVRDNNKDLIFRKDGILYPIKCRDIIYIECKNHELILHLVDNSDFTVQYRTCQNIIDEADSDILFQCNRRLIVNKEYVNSVDLMNYYVVVKREKLISLEIGFTFRKKVAGIFEKWS